MDTQGNATSNLSLTEIPAATLTDTVCHTTTENLDLRFVPSVRGKQS